MTSNPRLERANPYDLIPNWTILRVLIENLPTMAAAGSDQHQVGSKCLGIYWVEFGIKRSIIAHS
jgi:hypothetical protein